MSCDSVLECSQNIVERLDKFELEYHLLGSTSIAPLVIAITVLLSLLLFIHIVILCGLVARYVPFQGRTHRRLVERLELDEEPDPPPL